MSTSRRRKLLCGVIVSSALMFHQFIGSLVHYSLTRQIFRPTKHQLPEQTTFIDLVVDTFTRASQSPSQG